MRDLYRARRVGYTAVACAVLLRLFAAGVPEKLFFRLTKPNPDSIPSEQETGRNVRFSSSLDVFSPDFMESPPPSLPAVTEVPLPSFSGEETVKLYYAASVQPDIPALLAKPLQWDLTGDEPTVLILHTHSTESYSRRGENYKETSAWRTLDENYNMLAIGRLVADILEKKGIPTVQDESLHDYPSYNGSYTRARKSLRELLKQHPGIRLVLDLHRDASGDEAGQMRTRAEVSGEPSAQLMIVIGTNHEGYEENLSLGLKLHAQLERQAEGIMRPLQLRAQRFAAEQLAEAIAALARGTDPQE